jgi:hypothetical protein
MTYRQLKAHLSVMDDEQLEQNVTAHITRIDEYVPVADIDFTGDEGNGVLDAWHPFLIVDY